MMLYLSNTRGWIYFSRKYACMHARLPSFGTCLHISLPIHARVRRMQASILMKICLKSPLHRMRVPWRRLTAAPRQRHPTTGVLRAAHRATPSTDAGSLSMDHGASCTPYPTRPHTTNPVKSVKRVNLHQNC